MKVFVGGPIQYAIGQDGKFINEIREKFERIINRLEKDGIQVCSAHVEENYGESTDEYSNEQICIRDFSWMHECDKYISVFPNYEDGRIIHSGGTNVELGWATALNKDVIIICDHNKLHKLSKLIRGLNTICRVDFIDLDLVLKDPECLVDKIKCLNGDK